MSVADVVEYRWTVSAAVAESAGRLGPRLDDFLADRVPLVSRMHLRASVRSGAVLVDGRQAPPGLRLHVGAQVDARLDVGRATAMTPQQIPLEILHDDERFAVVVKPAGMLVHPTRGVKSGTLANALSGLWNQGEGPAVRPIFVHRLDKRFGVDRQLELPRSLQVDETVLDAVGRKKRRGGRRRPARPTVKAEPRPAAG